MTGSIRRIGAGALAMAIYVTSAWWSGQLSPAARRPLLDGLAPPTPYRWVEPPPALAGTNQPPAPGTFRVALGNRGNLTSVLTTDDAQVTVILPRGSFPPAEGQRALEVTIEPVAPSTVRPPPGPDTIVGNVVRLEAAYLPSGEPAELAPAGTDGARVVLVYPFEPNAHGGHEVVVSSDGLTWTAVDTNDLPSIQQVDGPLPNLGAVAVTGPPPPVTPEPVGGGSDAATIAIVAGLVVLALGTIWVLRPPRRPGPSRKGA